MTNIPTWNTWKGNTGNYNSGYRNSGYRNSGDRNSGYRNSGYRNSGDRNSGYRNSGDRNSGDRNSGYLNSDTPKVRIFNKDTDINYEDFDSDIFPQFFYFDYNTTEWISEDNMTDEEKQQNPLYNIAWWYLKKLIPNTTDKESKEEWIYKAWRASWDKATDEDRRKVYSIPNWDNEVFKEISGIDVDKELNTPKAETLAGKTVEVKLDWITYKAIIQ